MEDQQKVQLFERTPVPQAIIKLAVPTILSSLVMVLYNLADTYFVGMLNDPIQNAGVTLDVYKRQTYASPIDATLVDSILGDPNIDLGQSDFSGSYQMLFGCSRKPGDDLNFRNAVAYAIDYSAAATAVSGAYGKLPSRAILNPACKGFDESIAMLEYNPETAKRMLDEAGYVDQDGDGWRDLPDGSAMDL